MKKAAGLPRQTEDEGMQELLAAIEKVFPDLDPQIVLKQLEEALEEQREQLQRIFN